MTIFFFVQKRLQRHPKQPSRRFIKEEIKKRLMDSLVHNENIDTEDLNERANIVEVESYGKAMDIINEYKDIVKENRKNIIFFAYQQGKSF